MVGGIPKQGMELQLLQFAEQRLSPLGFAVVDVDFHAMGKSLVRFFVDRQTRAGVPTAGTSLDDCSEASRLLGEELEASDLIPGSFELEVSSPGLDRRLRTLADFQLTVGSRVNLRFVEKLTDLGLGAKVAAADLLSADAAAVQIGVAGKRYKIPWARVRQATKVWQPEKSVECG